MKEGIEVFLKVIDYIGELQEKLPKGSILRIEGVDKQRRNVYKRLLKYTFKGKSFKVASFYAPDCGWNGEEYYFLEV